MNWVAVAMSSIFLGKYIIVQIRVVGEGNIVPPLYLLLMGTEQRREAEVLVRYSYRYL